jgi:hypothetical protein
MLDTIDNSSSGGLTPAHSNASLPPHRSSPGGYAIAAFVLGIISFATCGPCAGLPALIIGLIELRNIRNHVSPVEGRPFALAGAILGGINSALAILLVILYVLFMLFFFLAGTSPNWSWS